MSDKSKNNIFIYGVGLISTLLVITCPLLEYWKIQLFKSHNLPINESVEYSYFGIAVVNFALYFFFCCGFEKNKFSWIFSIATVLWLIIAITYTYFTRYELGDIPFSCPADYGFYPFSEARRVCQVRTANLICMWLMNLASFIVTLLLFNITEEDFKELSTRSLSYNGESTGDLSSKDFESGRAAVEEIKKNLQT